jgi:hypothetical protein
MTRPGGVRTPVRGQEAGIRDAKPATMVRTPVRGQEALGTRRRRAHRRWWPPGRGTGNVGDGPPPGPHWVRKRPGYYTERSVPVPVAPRTYAWPPPRLAGVAALPPGPSVPVPAGGRRG